MSYTTEEKIIKNTLDLLVYKIKITCDDNSFNTYKTTILKQIDLVNHLTVYKGNDDLYSLVQGCNKNEISSYIDGEDILSINSCIGKIQCTALQDCDSEL